MGCQSVQALIYGYTLSFLSRVPQCCSASYSFYVVSEEKYPKNIKMTEITQPIRAQSAWEPVVPDHWLPPILRCWITTTPKWRWTHWFQKLSPLHPNLEPESFLSPVSDSPRNWVKEPLVRFKVYMSSKIYRSNFIAAKLFAANCAKIISKNPGFSAYFGQIRDKNLKIWWLM